MIHPGRPRLQSNTIIAWLRTKPSPLAIPLFTNPCCPKLETIERETHTSPLQAGSSRNLKKHVRSECNCDSLMNIIKLKFPYAVLTSEKGCDYGGDRRARTGNFNRDVTVSIVRNSGYSDLLIWQYLLIWTTYPSITIEGSCC